MTKGAALPKSCGLCLPCVLGSRSANVQSTHRVLSCLPSSFILERSCGVQMSFAMAGMEFLRVCEEISVNNQIFYDNELAEGLF